MRFNPAYLRRIACAWPSPLHADIVIISLSYAIMKAAPGKPFQTRTQSFARSAGRAPSQVRFHYGQYLRASSCMVISAFPIRTQFHRGGNHRRGAAGVLELACSLGHRGGLRLGGGIAIGPVRGRWFEGGVMAFAMIGIAVQFRARLLLQPYARCTGASRRWPAGTASTARCCLGVTLSLTSSRTSSASRAAASWRTQQGLYIARRRAKGCGVPGAVETPAPQQHLPVSITWRGHAISHGNLVVEKIFNIPAWGYFIESCSNATSPWRLGVIIVYSIFLLSLNLLADIILTCPIRASNCNKSP